MKNNKAKQPEFLTVSKTARMLHTTNRTLNKWIEEGAFPAPAIKPDGRRLFRRAEIDAWFDQNRENAEYAEEIDREQMLQAIEQELAELEQSQASQI